MRITSGEALRAHYCLRDRVCGIIEVVTWTWTVPNETVIKFNTCRVLISISGIVVRHDDEASRTNTYVDETLSSAGRQLDYLILI